MLAPGAGHACNKASEPSNCPAVPLASVNAIQPLLQLGLLHVCELLEAQTDTGMLRRIASLRAVASAVTRLFVAAVVRLLAENCRRVGVAMPTRMATTASTVRISKSVNPCWVFRMAAQSARA